METLEFQWNEAGLCQNSYRFLVEGDSAESQAEIRVAQYINGLWGSGIRQSRVVLQSLHYTTCRFETAEEATLQALALMDLDESRRERVSKLLQGSLMVAVLMYGDGAYTPSPVEPEQPAEPEEPVHIVAANVVGLEALFSSKPVAPKPQTGQLELMLC